MPTAEKKQGKRGIGASTRPSRPWRAFLAGAALVTGAGLAHAAPLPETMPSPPNTVDAFSSALIKAQSDAQAKRIERQGHPDPVLRLTRDGAVTMALENNPSLTANRLAPEVAAAKVRVERAAFEPSLSLEGSRRSVDEPAGSLSVSGDRTRADMSIGKTLPAGTSVGASGGLQRISGVTTPGTEGFWTVDVNHPLLKGAGSRVNLVRVRQAENRQTRSEQELRGFTLGLVRSVENAYWELVTAREVLAIREFGVRLAQEQLQLTKDLIAVGRQAAETQASADADLALREADLIGAQAAVRQRTYDLLALLAPSGSDRWASSVEVPPVPAPEDAQIDPEVSASLAAAFRPDLAQARIDLANQTLEVVRTRNGLLPYLAAFASYGAPSATLNDEDRETTVGLRFELPLGRRAERGAHTQATLQEEQAREALANLELVVASDVRQKAVEADKQQKRVPATTALVTARRKELSVERGRFRVGKSTNLDVLRVQEKLIDARLQETEARIGFFKALADLYNAEGTLLLRRGIHVTSKQGGSR